MGRVKDLLPDDWEGYDGPDEPECDHADFDMDWDGRARCQCGHSWYLTAEQMEAYHRWEQEYAEYEAEQSRRYNVWWRRLGRWIYHHRPSFRSQEIPF